MLVVAGVGTGSITSSMTVLVVVWTLVAGSVVGTGGASSRMDFAMASSSASRSRRSFSSLTSLPRSIEESDFQFPISDTMAKITYYSSTRKRTKALW